MIKTMTTLALIAAMFAAAPVSAYAHRYARDDQGPVMNNNAPKVSLDAKAFFEQIQRDSN